jgi:hypothetical protein
MVGRAREEMGQFLVEYVERYLRSKPNIKVSHIELVRDERCFGYILRGLINSKKFRHAIDSRELEQNRLSPMVVAGRLGEQIYNDYVESCKMDDMEKVQDCYVNNVAEAIAKYQESVALDSFAPITFQGEQVYGYGVLEPEKKVEVTVGECDEVLKDAVAIKMQTLDTKKKPKSTIKHNYGSDDYYHMNEEKKWWQFWK